MAERQVPERRRIGTIRSFRSATIGSPVSVKLVERVGGGDVR